MIGIIQLRTGRLNDNIAELIAQNLGEKGITREKLIDIKYSVDDGIHYCLIIYEV